MEQIESMVSDVRAELRSLNRRLGCLIVVLVLVAVIGFVTAIVLFNQAIHLY